MSEVELYSWDKETPTLTMSKEELMGLEDLDLRRYLVGQGAARTPLRKKVDDDDKLAYYMLEQRLCINKKGTVYNSSKLMQYIVYKKATRKIFLSKNNDYVFMDMVYDYFYYPSYVKMMCPKVSPALCKKMIEGNISTTRDIVQYYKSYFVKDKNVSLETTHKFMALRSLHCIKGAEDPENIQFDTPLGMVNYAGISLTHNVGYKISEVEEHEKKVERWVAIQANKADTLARSRNAEAGNKTLHKTRC